VTAKFNLETPVDDALPTVSRFSGWYIPEHPRRPHLVIKCNGQIEAALEWGSIRTDVFTAFPDQPRSIISGFQGDLLLHSDHDHAACIDVAVVDELQGEVDLFRRTYSVGPIHSHPQREKSFDVVDLLVCPTCDVGLGRTARELSCPRCLCRVSLRGEVPHFLHDRGTPCLHLTERTATNPYSTDVLEILDRKKDGLVLDFGAGHTPQEQLRPNVVYVDAVQYRWTDVVCTQPRFPFRDQTFDAVVSQAVFEHLPDPHQTARELCRILRPGGIIHVDTAFMQPLHGDPWHYFNMTQHGLRQVMAPFEELRSGIKSYQSPSASLLMQVEAIMPFISSRAWKNKISRWHAELQQGAAELDRALGEVGRATLAAGFYFEGRRPRQ